METDTRESPKSIITKGITDRASTSLSVISSSSCRSDLEKIGIVVVIMSHDLVKVKTGKNFQ